MIKDSGERRIFESGAVRDIQIGKGRCDLLPLEVVADVMCPESAFETDLVLYKLCRFTQTGDVMYLYAAITLLADIFDGIPNMLLEVSMHFEEGAVKYGENNWQKGLPANCYIDSAVRHYLKLKRGDCDERHDRACVWNLMCCAWTCINIPELNTYLKPKVNNA